jgi:plasmid stabilization system protein ParE
VNRPFDIEMSNLAKTQIPAPESWWRIHRPTAPNAIREDVERACALIARRPDIGTAARNATLSGVRRLRRDRIRYYVYYQVSPGSQLVEILAFWHASRGHPPL